MFACFTDQPQVKMQVVQAQNRHRQHFIGFEKMAHIGFVVIAIYEEIAVFVQHAEIALVFLVAHVANAFACEHQSVARIARRHHAIKHIYAQGDVFEQVGGLLRCGSTGTNVCDLRVALVAQP